MTPQNLLTALLQMDESAGYAALQKQLPSFDSNAQQQLIELIKREADSRWTNEAHLAYLLAGHLLSVGKLLDSRYAHALGLMARGDALRRMDRDREAIKLLDAAGEEFLSVGDEVGWARTRIGRISACLQLNLTSEALRDAAAAREVFMRYNKLLRAGQIDVNAAIIHFELGHYEQALRLYDRAIETYQLQSGGVDLHIARARGNKAIALAALGRFREAIALHEQARATFAARGGQEISVAREELNIAEIYAAQGHYSQALLLFNRSRDIFSSHGLELPAAEVAQLICSCLLRLNRSREAYELAGELINYFQQSQSHRSNVAQSLLFQAEAAMLAGDLRDADVKLREARTILEEIGSMALASKVRLQQAELYFVSEDYEDSLREARFVADAFAEQEALPYLARAALLQAHILANTGDTDSAQELCQQALDIAQGQGLLDLKYRCDYLLGQIAEYHHNTDAAASYYDRAIKGIEDLQSHLVLDERSSFLEDKGAVYQRAMVLACNRHQTEQALVYVEKAKSRVLGDYLRNNIDIRLRAADKASEAILEDLAHLREEQAWYSSIVYESEYEANLSDTAVMRVRALKPGQARQEMQQRERGIEHLLEQIQLRLAGDLVSRSRSNWTDSIVTSLWQKLERNTLMLEYYLTANDLYIFQLTRAGVETQIIQGVVPRLERLLSLWRVNLDLAAQASGAQDRAQAFAGLQENSLGLLQRLYDVLLRPVENALSACEHLTIVPYGLLHYLPFHCLFDGVQFVIERVNVSYLPAAALHDICRQRGKRISSKGVFLQNSLVMGLSDNGRLAFARQEAEAVAKLLGAPCAINEAATTSLLKEVGARSPIVHIAAHGMFRLDAPNFSYIQLADHKLDTIEVFNLDLSSCSLLTLSACETGRAIVRGVDEVIGLGRGFLYAGAASLLPTLWNVDDASSAELMEMFYQALLSDFPKAAALAGAQRAFLARSRTSIRPYRVHPYFWAGFHLIGDAGPL
ncbi:MAG TPA: CHAT domain-containing tetratricopeptide repeat protein [Ktedonobacteraceae bacterium]|nr:CHAT domain-containing tetratricopeptide repeat protein [Ktedonobacteraceae bacterium]